MRRLKRGRSPLSLTQYVGKYICRPGPRVPTTPLCPRQDGLWLVSQQPSVIQGYQKGILTPNLMEFTRLYESLVRLSDPPRVHHTHGSTCSCWRPRCLAVLAPRSHGQHRSETQRHATQRRYGQRHPGAERGAGSDL